MRIKKPSLPEWKEWANEELASLYFARAAVLMDDVSIIAILLMLLGVI